MLSIERQRKNRTTLIQLKSASNVQEKDKHIQRLGGSIKASIDRLKRLKTQIQAETNLRRIAILLADLQKQNNTYNELQASLAQIDQNSDMLTRIKKMNKDFIQNYDPQQLKKKLNYMKAERSQHLKTQNFVQMSALSEQQLSGQLLAQDKHAIRYKILMQQKQQLDQIQRLLGQVKDIATKTSIMINEQGQRLELTVEKMKNANKNLREGRELLQQTNQYQVDTTKKYACCGCLIIVIVGVIVAIMWASHSK